MPCCMPRLAHSLTPEPSDSSVSLRSRPLSRIVSFYYPTVCLWSFPSLMPTGRALTCDRWHLTHLTQFGIGWSEWRTHSTNNITCTAAQRKIIYSECVKDILLSFPCSTTEREFSLGICFTKLMRLYKGHQNASGNMYSEYGVYCFNNLSKYT